MTLMSHPDSRRFKCILASAGLAQNFAALRALVSEGISRGHMALHAQSIALAAGVCAEVLPECVAWMRSTGKIAGAAAREYVRAHALHAEINSQATGVRVMEPVDVAAGPSMFYLDLDGDVNVHVAFHTLGPGMCLFPLTFPIKTCPTVGPPVYLQFSHKLETDNRTADESWSRMLFGDKGLSWIQWAFSALLNTLPRVHQAKEQSGDTSAPREERHNREFSDKVKV